MERRWFEQGGDAAKVFRQSLEAGGLITDDVLRVCAAVDGMLRSGLTRETLIHLVVLAGPRHKGGGRHNMPVLNPKHVGDVLEALENMPAHLAEAKKPELAKRIAEMPSPRPDGLTDDEWAALKAMRAKAGK